jgi:hypothetical protein
LNNKIVTVPQENIINPPDADDVTRGIAFLVVADINNNNEYIQINGTALTGKFFPAKQALKNVKTWPSISQPINKLQHGVLRNEYMDTEAIDDETKVIRK